MFYVISVHVRGLDKSIEAIEKELIHTKVYRLTKKARNKLMAQKVSLYQWLERNSSFKVGDSYVIHESKMREFREFFERKQQRFRELVREVHEELRRKWPEQRRDVENELRRRITGIILSQSGWICTNSERSRSHFQSHEEARPLWMPSHLQSHMTARTRNRMREGPCPNALPA